MSTITREFTKEQLQQIIETDHVQCGEASALARIVLASLEAEPVAWLLSGGGAKNNVSFDSGNAYADPLRDVTPLYTAPPVPVSVPAAYEHTEDFSEYHEGWNACRSAMLQGAEPVTTAYKLPFEQWLSQQTGTIDVEYGCVMTEVFFHWLRVAYEAGNSPVIQDGWVLVPVEPTMSQEFAGYRTLTDTGKMSRLMKTRLSNIYRAMLAAAPQQEAKP